MKGTSKVIMGATLVLAVSLAMVLVLILVLLAELYCSLLLRRRRLRTTASASATQAAIPAAATSSPPRDRSSSRDDHDSNDHDHHRRDAIAPATTSNTPLSSFYAPGVLQAPRSLLFPVVSSAEKQSLSELHPHQLVIDIPKKITEPAKEQEEAISAASSCGNNDKHFVYISNPIYENAEEVGPDTPFETPDSSPSRLEEIGGSGSSSPWSSPMTPPLTPMKKLPAEASSVSLGDGRSLGTESDSNNGLSNSSSSATPCTSPSW